MMQLIGSHCLVSILQDEKTKSMSDIFTVLTALCPSLRYLNYNDKIMTSFDPFTSKCCSDEQEDFYPYYRFRGTIFEPMQNHVIQITFKCYSQLLCIMNIFNKKCRSFFLSNLTHLIIFEIHSADVFSSWNLNKIYPQLRDLFPAEFGNLVHSRLVYQHRRQHAD